MAKKKAVEVEAPTAPPVGMWLEFASPDNTFIGVIESLEPFVVVEHKILNGCHSENEIEVAPEDYVLRPLTKDEVYAALY